MKLLPALLTLSLLAQPVLPQQEEPTFRTTTKLVIVNLTVHGRDGRSIENLKKEDFTILEDGKPQQIHVFELERPSTEPLPALAPASFATRQPAPASSAKSVETEKAPTASPTDLQNRRLMTLLFDFSSMQPPEQIRTRDAALKFLSTQMTSSDLVSIMTFGNQLNVVQNFTADRDLLVSVIKRFRIGESSELATDADTGADAEDQSGTFVADDTEFNIFNTDRKLAALEEAARRLAQYPEKKALVYFSSGVSKTGVDNQSQLRATVNTAVRANVAFYPIDARGLSASAPGGDAAQAGAPGSNLFSGAGQRSLKDKFQDQQETLYTLADDTGGKALLDSNDLTIGITQAQKDISSYYILGYFSSNDAEDGRFRRIQVKLREDIASSLKAKLDYRPGYFAPKTFGKMNENDKESALQEALNSENPVTNLPLAVEIDYFRLAKGKYFIPVSVKIPGSALTLKSKGSKQATELDFIGQVRDARSHVVSVVRDTIPLKVNEAVASQFAQKNIQYDTGMTLAPGSYTLRFVARENGQGKTGTFEAKFTVPDLNAGNTLRLSSVILSNQRQTSEQQIAGVKANKKLLAENPLIDEKGQKLVPNVTRAFRPGQNLFVYFEVYDPSVPESMPANFRVASVSANIAFYRDGKKVFESAPVRVNRFPEKRPAVLPVQIQTPLISLPPGSYSAQVNVIDELGKKFAFPRTSLVVMEPLPQPTATPASPSGL